MIIYVDEMLFFYPQEIFFCFFSYLRLLGENPYVQNEERHNESILIRHTNRAETNPLRCSEGSGAHALL